MTITKRRPRQLPITAMAMLAGVTMLAGCTHPPPTPAAATSMVDTSVAVASSQESAPLSSAPVSSTVSTTPSVSHAPVAPMLASCALLTRADARSLIAGAALNPGTDVPATDPVSYSSSCTYNAPPTAPSGQVEIYVTNDVPNALTIDRSIKRKFRSVAGIGDQTVEEPDNGNIFVHQGKWWVYLTIPFGATPATLERGARLIASRMPAA